MAFKIVALENLSSHHPELETYLKPLIERYGSPHVRVFFKQLMSNKINANLENHVPASAKFKFDPLIMEPILRTLLSLFLKRQNTSNIATAILASLPLAL